MCIYWAHKNPRIMDFYIKFWIHKKPSLLTNQILARFKDFKINNLGLPEVIWNPYHTKPLYYQIHVNHVCRILDVTACPVKCLYFYLLCKMWWNIVAKISVCPVEQATKILFCFSKCWIFYSIVIELKMIWRMHRLYKKDFKMNVHLLNIWQHYSISYYAIIFSIHWNYVPVIYHLPFTMWDQIYMGRGVTLPKHKATVYF